jgi:hypothetical protein
MKQVLICHSSVRFARTAYGVMTLIAFLSSNIWILLITAILMGIGALSTDKYNLFSQFHKRILRPLIKDVSQPVHWDPWELRFAYGLGTSFLLTAFFLIYSGKAINEGWILVLILSLLMLFAGFSGICLVTIICAGLKKIFSKK